MPPETISQLMDVYTTMSNQMLSSDVSIVAWVLATRPDVVHPTMVKELMTVIIRLSEEDSLELYNVPWALATIMGRAQ